MKSNNLTLSNIKELEIFKNKSKYKQNLIKPIKKGLLDKYKTKRDKDVKYTELSKRTRELLLIRACKDVGGLTIFRRLNYMSILNKNRTKIKNIFETDKNYVKYRFFETKYWKI